MATVVIRRDHEFSDGFVVRKGEVFRFVEKKLDEVNNILYVLHGHAENYPEDKRPSDKPKEFVGTVDNDGIINIPMDQLEALIEKPCIHVIDSKYANELSELEEFFLDKIEALEEVLSAKISSYDTVNKANDGSDNKNTNECCNCSCSENNQSTGTVGVYNQDIERLIKELLADDDIRRGGVDIYIVPKWGSDNDECDCRVAEE